MQHALPSPRWRPPKTRPHMMPPTDTRGTPCARRHSLALVATYLDQVGDPSGTHGYYKSGQPSSRYIRKSRRLDKGFPVEKGACLPATALRTRFLMGQSPRFEPIMNASADLIMSKLPEWDVEGGAIDLGYWYHGTHAMFQIGRPHWRKWQSSIREALRPNQRKDGHLAGSWDPVGVRGKDDGRVYATAMAWLTLQAEYRYARSEGLTILPNEAPFKPANRSWKNRQYNTFSRQLKSARRNKKTTAAQQKAIDRAASSLAAVVATTTLELEAFSTPLTHSMLRERVEQIATQFGSLPVGILARKLLSQKK